MTAPKAAIPPAPTPERVAAPAPAPGSPPSSGDFLRAAFYSTVVGAIVMGGMQCWAQDILYSLFFKLDESHWGSWRMTVYPTCLIGFTAAPLLAQWLATGRASPTDALKSNGPVLVAMIAFAEWAWRLSGYRLLKNGEEGTDPITLLAALVAISAAAGLWFARQRRTAPGFAKREYRLMTQLGVLGGFASSIFTFFVVVKNLLPDHKIMGACLAIGVLGWWLNALFGAASLRAAPAVASPRRQAALPQVVSVGLGLVGTWALLLFWRRGDVYSVNWDVAGAVGETLVLIGWVLGAFGVASSLEQARGRRVAWVVSAVIALAALLVVRFYWHAGEELFGLNHEPINSESVTVTPAPSFLVPFSLALAIVGGGSIAFARSLPLKVRALAYDATAALVAGLVGFGASRLPYDAPSVEARVAFPIWAMVLAVALVAFAWSHLRLVVAMRGPAAAQAN